MNFKDWVIARNLDKNTPRGDFARDAMRDIKAPKADDRNAWIEHLCRLHACPEAVKVFGELFAEYKTWRKKNRCF